MNSFLVEKFYLFFQGVLVFETLFLGTLFFITRKRDILFYSIYLLLQTIYFFWNAPHTFFNLDDNAIFNSSIYLFINTPLIIISNLVYIFFLRAFFSGLYFKDRFYKFIGVFVFIGIILIIISITFIYYKINQQFIFYTVNFLSTAFSIYVLINIKEKSMPFVSWVVVGIILNIIGNALTILMIVLWRYNVHHLFTDEYPLFFMRCGILADIFLYQMAILKKWNYQEKQLATKEFEKQLALEKLRNTISGELHDDLGSILSGVSMYSHLTNRQMANGELDNAKVSILIIQQSADEMISKLEDLVWSVNPKQDSLVLLFERLEQYGRQMCAAKNIEFTFVISENIAKIIILQEQRHHLHLIVKEAINNALKYSEATELSLSIQLKNSLLEIVIIDNGKGFQTSTIKRGNGLNNMQQRAAQLQAYFRLQSKVGAGCCVLLQIKLN